MTTQTIPFCCSRKDCERSQIVPGDITLTMQAYLESLGWHALPSGEKLTCPDCVRAALIPTPYAFA